MTPGQATHAAPEEFACQVGPTQLVFTKELGFSKWANWYRDGLDLVPVEIEEISGKAIPRHIKCRSRLHYYLAEQNAKQVSSQSRALLSSPEGGIAEATIAGIVMVKGEVMVAPPENAVLQSITFEVLKEIALEQGLSVERRAIDLDELKKADEVLWLNSSCCLAPVRSIAGESLGASRPVFQRLIQAWSKRFGVDLVRQATQLSISND